MKVLILIGLIINTVYTFPLPTGKTYKRLTDLSPDDQAFVKVLLSVDASNPTNPNLGAFKGQPEDDFVALLDFCNTFANDEPNSQRMRNEMSQNETLAKDFLMPFNKMIFQISSIISPMPLSLIESMIETSKNGPTTGTPAVTQAVTGPPAIALSFPMSWPGLEPGMPGYPSGCPAYPGTDPGLIGPPGGPLGSSVWFLGAPKKLTVSTTETTMETTTSLLTSSTVFKESTTELLGTITAGPASTGSSETPTTGAPIESTTSNVGLSVSTLKKDETSTISTESSSVQSSSVQSSSVQSSTVQSSSVQSSSAQSSSVQSSSSDSVSTPSSPVPLSSSTATVLEVTGTTTIPSTSSSKKDDVAPISVTVQIDPSVTQSTSTLNVETVKTTIVEKITKNSEKITKTTLANKKKTTKKKKVATTPKPTTKTSKIKKGQKTTTKSHKKTNPPK